MKLTTVRATRNLTILGVAATIGEVLLFTQFADHGRDAVRGFVVNLSFATTLLAIIAGIIVCVHLTSEYATGMMRVTFVAWPHRTQVLVSKLIVAVAFVAAYTTVVTVVAYVVGVNRLESAGVRVELDAAQQRTVTAMPFLAVLQAIAIFGVGLLVRSPIGTFAVFLGWAVALETALWMAFASASSTMGDPTEHLPVHRAYEMLTPDIAYREWRHSPVLLMQLLVVLVVTGLLVNRRRDA